MSQSFPILLSRTRRVLQGVRAPDTSTAEGRAHFRIRRVAATAATASVSKVLSMVSLFLSVSLTVRALGAERYGIWMTVGSALSLFTFADLGIGAGLMNLVAHADGSNNREEAARAVSNAFVMLSGIALLWASLFALAYRHVPWSSILNVHSPAAVREAAPTVAVFAGCFAVTLPLSLVERVQFGYQEGSSANLWKCVGSTLSIAALAAAVRARAGLPVLVLAFVGSPILALLANGMFLFGWHRRWLRPTLRRVRLRAIAGLVRIGSAFVALQVVFHLATCVDNLIIAQVMGSAYVGRYAVCARWFSVGVAVVSLVTTPLWPAYREALSRGDSRWIRITVWRVARLVGFGAAAIAILLVAAGRPAIRVWAGAAMVPSPALLCGLGVWMVAECIRIVVSTFLLAIDIVRVQVWIMAVFALTSIPLKVLLGREWGLPAVAWTGAITTLLFVTVPYLCYLRRWSSHSAEGAT